MINEKVTIDGQDITLFADENATIRIWVSDVGAVCLPLVHDGRLTIRLTAAGLEALKANREFTYADIEEVGFEGND